MITCQEMILKRMNAGHSLRSLAAEIKVGYPVIARLEAGKSISMSNAKKLADFYGCAVSDLPFMQDRLLEAEVEAA